MLRTSIIPTFLLTVSLLTQSILSSPTGTGPITAAPAVPTDLVEELRRRGAAPFSLPSIAWSEINLSDLFPWLYSSETGILSPQATGTICSQYSVPGGSLATYCATIEPSITGALGSSLASESLAAGNTASTVPAVGSAVVSSPAAASTGADGGTIITSFVNTGGAAAATTTSAAQQSGNHAPGLDQGRSISCVVAVVLLVISKVTVL